MRRRQQSSDFQEELSFKLEQLREQKRQFNESLAQEDEQFGEDLRYRWEVLYPDPTKPRGEGSPGTGARTEQERMSRVDSSSPWYQYIDYDGTTNWMNRLTGESRRTAP